MLDNTFEALLRGHPVVEWRCINCTALLPFVELQNPGHRDAGTTSVCTVCGMKNVYTGFHSPLGRYDPKLWTVDGITSVFMPIKGAFLRSKDPENPALGQLGASSPVLVMDEEIRPLQVVDPSL